MSIVFRSLLALAFAATLPLSSIDATATELRFTETQMPLGTTNSQVHLTGAEYAAFGITVTDVYRYIDSRDPFSDGAENFGGSPFGLSLDGPLALVDFASPVSNLEIDWWTITGRMTIDVYDAANNLLGSFAGSGSGTYSLAVSGIDHFTWHDSGGFVQVANIRFDAPEPATLLLVGLGLFIAVFAGRGARRS